MSDLSKHKLQSLSDSTWLNEYIAQMGEKPFWEYRNKLYSRLNTLQPGEEFDIVKHVAPENYDLFIKMVCCFISEAPFRCRFNEECTLFRRCLMD